MGIYNTLSIGEWCLFLTNQKLIVGQILCFQSIAPRGRYRPYRLDTAPVSETPQNISKLVVVCNWFQQNDGHLLSDGNQQEPIPVDCYMGHINPPRKTGSTIKLDNASLLLVQDVVQTNSTTEMKEVDFV